MALKIQWLDTADISRLAFGASIEEVEKVIRSGHDEPNPAHLPKGRRYRLGKTNDGRTLRVEITESADHRSVTVQLVVIDPDRL